MNYAEIRKYDVTNGPGIRTTLFVSGCTNNCAECFNKELQNFSYGNEWTEEIEELFISYCKNENIRGVSILGGDPLDQIRDKALLNLLKRIKEETALPIWLWSGYTYDEIIKDKNKSEILQYVDVLIDGRYEKSLRNISLKYRGSSNQRVIDLKETRKLNKVVEIEL